MSGAIDTCVSNRRSLVFLAITLLSFLAASSVPTPLYHLYQENLHFSPAVLTLIFGVYAMSLLAALLTVGSLSDHLGRRPVIFVALLLNILAMLLFINESGVQWLIAARVMQGFATGMATSVLGAALLDTDRQQGPLVSSVAPLLGMACGAMGASLLVEFAPWPLQLSYWLLLGVFVLQAGYVWRLPESVSPQPGAWASLKPTLHVPVQARRALWLALPVDVAVWAVGGFYLSLAPSLVRAATGSTSNLIGGGLVAVLTLSGALMIYSLRQHPADRVLRLGAGMLAAGVMLILAAVHSASLLLFFFGTLVLGSGFGAGFLGALRSVVPLALPHERAGLMSAFYVLSYLAFCLPALLAGNLTRSFGLIATTDGYGAVLVLLSLGALLALIRQRPVAACGASGL
ncbi:putative MFS family arabinose efflux permease [Pseudomonas protegens]|uniref:MFS transporter n=1 Tax=Pseudomonas TaxID=286 RepID=UPI0004425A87|nr:MULTISPECIES: MFS transporter [Pseudomonas]GED74757.1 MFS transporter [Pseudomonas fluorescens]AQT11354.1 major facilitator family transporter [Pseudomonas protegens]MCS4262327.1 putative MFS family arabinose efflux permease [Pseudomonas sp. BIGb0176]ROQ52217.1 putative MFS family arabinose efflux permease [Pseudomonas protegens]ROQ79167.1 putative MFS family arabinose efflux permease [Pseudomonas protegens]